MFIFSQKGRTAYLEFVRNLPSQVLLLAPCLFLPQLNSFSWSSPFDVAALIAFAAMFFFAFSANFVSFVEAASNREAVRKVFIDIRSSGVSGWRLFLIVPWRVLIKEFASLIVVMLIAYAGVGLVGSMVFWAYFPKH